MSTLWVLAVKMEVHFEPKRHPSSDKRAWKEASIALLGAANREGGEVEVPSSKGGKTIRKPLLFQSFFCRAVLLSLSSQLDDLYVPTTLTLARVPLLQLPL